MVRKSVIIRNSTQNSLLLIIEPEYSTYEIGVGSEALVIADSDEHIFVEYGSDNCISVNSNDFYSVHVDGVEVKPTNLRV